MLVINGFRLEVVKLRLFGSLTEALLIHVVFVYNDVVQICATCSGPC